ncbi:hypothetical protein ACFP9V_22745 [Deinococcus radiopugnans]|uniref:hypothetical protein n=1 Tax=Deinococcus radiopugnans TaxID=57497 RepID=UPI0036074415
MGSLPIARAFGYWDVHDHIMFLQDGRQLYGVYFEPPSHLHYTADDLLRRQSTLATVFDLVVPDGETLTTYTSLRGRWTRIWPIPGAMPRPAPIRRCAS